jgi:hypothetical protein
MLRFAGYGRKARGCENIYHEEREGDNKVKKHSIKSIRTRNMCLFGFRIHSTGATKSIALNDYRSVRHIRVKNRLVMARSSMIRGCFLRTFSSYSSCPSW